MSQPLIQNEHQVNRYLADNLFVSMLQINLREGEIKDLKESNVKLKQELAQIVDERNKISSEKKQQLKRVNELNEKVIGKEPL